MGEVQILEKTRTAPNSRSRSSNGAGGHAVRVERIRVAAYCRVSTDGDEQLGSFESQKLYYEQKIADNPEWVNAGNFDDVLDVVLSYVEESANNDDNIRRKQQIDKDISALESKKSRMTDMLIDGTITKEVYDEKLVEFTRKLHTLSDRRKILADSINTRNDINKRMSELRETLEKEDILDEFDRTVFESIIEKVYVGGYEEDGTPDPYKLTFILKGNQTGTIPHAKEAFKEKQKETRKSEDGKKVS